MLTNKAQNGCQIIDIAIPGYTEVYKKRKWRLTKSLRLDNCRVFEQTLFRLQ